MSEPAGRKAPSKTASKGPGRPATASGPRSCWKPWDGGRVWYDADGGPHFQIRRTIKGRKYQVTLPSGLTKDSAGAHLQRFLQDPEGYDPRGDVRAKPIYLDAARGQEFITWSQTYGGREEGGNSAPWVRTQKQHLAFWLEKLHGLDLRGGGAGGVDLGAHIMPALTKPGGKRVASYRQRIAVLKSLYGWLRTNVHRLKPAEDPTFGALKSPKSKSAQGAGSHKVIPVKDVLAVVELLREQGQMPDPLRAILAAAKTHLEAVGPRAFELKAVAKAAKVSPATIHYYFDGRDDLLASAKTGTCAAKARWRPNEGRWGDMLMLLLSTGWHVTELDRFMRDGSIEPIPEEGAQDPKMAGVAVVTCEKSKRGNRLKTRVSEEAHEVAKRLVGKGGFSQAEFNRVVALACKKTMVTDFRPGNMRHTVATYAQNHGAADTAIEAFLNHASNAAVLLKYYSRGVALKVPTPI